MDDIPAFIEALRAATEDDVAAALDGAYVETPLSHSADLLEFFNRMLDVLTGESDQAEATDLARIAAASRRAAKD
jgi:hypothetical protein